MRISLVLVLVAVVVADVDPLLHDKDHKKGGDHDAKYDHEAFLGKDGAKEFDELSPEQSKAKLEKLLTKIDTDADGYFTEDELKKHIRFMQERFVTNDVKRTWKQYDERDLTKDNELTWKAYRDRVYGPESDEISPQYAKMIKRDERRWKIADANSDKLINQKEYECFMHPEDCDSMKEIIVLETTEDIDKNGDGVVTIDEYITGGYFTDFEALDDMYRPSDYPDLPEGTEPDWVKSEREMFKDYRDKDGDGKLNKAEMTAWLTPEGFDHAEAEAHHLIHMADDDKDNKLTKEEILDHYDLFVGSQATDYGEQLKKHDPAEL